MMRKLLVLLMAMTAGAAAAAPDVFADPPTITPSPATDYVDMTSCAFPVSVHFTVNGETAKTFASGTTIITGPLRGVLRERKERHAEHLRARDGDCL
jgi:hypothetical protein